MIVQRIAGLLLGLWAGSLLTVCALAAPSLFAVLERHLAGQAATRLFVAEAVIGVLVVIAVLVAQRLGGFAIPRSVMIAILLGALAPLASVLILGPMMQAARQAGDMARFGALHGVSAALFVVACISALTSAWLFNRPAG